MNPLQLAGSARASIQAASSFSASIRDVRDIPPAFGEVDRQLPIAERALTRTYEVLQGRFLPPVERASLEDILTNCGQKAKQLEGTFANLKSGHGRARQAVISWDELRSQYREEVHGRKRYLVEELMNDILAAIEKLIWHEAFNQVVGFRANSGEVRKARRRLEDVEPSLADAEFELELPQLGNQREHQAASEPEVQTEPEVPSGLQASSISEDDSTPILSKTPETEAYIKVQSEPESEIFPPNNDFTHAWATAPEAHDVLDAQSEPMVRSNIPTEATVQNVQNLSQGGIGQQNIPQGGTNMFNAGEFVITGEHATVNFDSHESYLRGLFTLGQIDPVSDKRSIERRKGGLLRQSYQWILSNADFKRWRQDPDVGLLWIRGDPGKGKTMLLCGVIDELSRQKSQGEQNLAFFFCLDERRDDAVGVVRGLLASLFVQQPDIRRSYETRFRGQPPLNVTSWEVLREVMEGVFRDPRLRETCIIIDALDECRHGLWDLLALISRMPSPRIKFLLASRSSDRIQQALKVGTAVGNRLLSLELNSEAISEAVYSYIEHRLAGYEGYDAALKQEARQYLQKNSGSTFLWVALVIQELATDRTPRWKLGSLLDRLRAFPSSLEELYKRIWSNMLITHENEDVDVDTRRSLCPRILALVLTVERPVSLTEASLLIDWPADFPINDLARQEAIGYCRSFVTIGVDDKVIHMVHQSAKDFLLKHAVGMLFPSGAAFHHLNIAQVSLMVISKTLHEGMRPPANRKDRRRSASAPSQQKSVDAATYSCLYWVDHLQLGLVAQPKKVQHQYLKDGGPVHVFLQTHLLHWFEFIALHGAVSTGITALSTLITLSTAILPVDTVPSQLFKRYSAWGRLKGSISKVIMSPDSMEQLDGPQLLPFARDALKCLRVYGAAIEDSPMQVYASMLLFSPLKSLVRLQYLDAQSSGGNLGWVRLAKPVARDWTACTHTLHAPESFEPAGRAVFSADGSRIALLLQHGTLTRVQIWDTMLGREVVWLKAQADGLSTSRFVFSPCGKLFALAMRDGKTWIMDAATGNERTRITRGPNNVQSVFFTADGNTIMMVSCGTPDAVSAFDTNSGKLLGINTYRRSPKDGRLSIGREIILLPGNKKAVVATSTLSLVVHNLEKGGLCEIEVPCGQLACPGGHKVLHGAGQAGILAMSPEGRFVSYTCYPAHCMVTVLETETRKHWYMHCSHNQGVKEATMAMAWAVGDRLLTWDPGNSPAVLTITDVRTRKPHKMFVGRNHRETRLVTVCVHPNKPLVALGCSDGVGVRLGNIEEGVCVAIYQGHDARVHSLTFSPDGNILASVTKSGTTKLWDVRGDHGQGEKQGRGEESAHKLAGRMISHVVVSDNARYVATRSHERAGQAAYHFVDVWDTQTGASQQFHRSATFLASRFSFIESGRRPSSTLRMALAPTNDRIALLEDSDSHIVVRSLEDGSRTWRGVLYFKGRPDLQGSHVQFSPSGDQVVGLGYYGNVARFTFGESHPLKLMALREQEILQAEMMHICSQDLQYSAHSYQIGRMMVIDVRRLRVVGESWKLSLPTSSIASMALSSDGRHLAVAFGDKIRVFEFGHDESNSEFSSFSGRRPTRTLSREDGVNVCSVAFSSDSASIVTVSADDMVWIWDRKTGACRYKMAAWLMAEHIENGQLRNPVNMGPLESAVALGKPGPDLAPMFSIRPRSSHTCITRNGIDVLWLPSELRVRWWEVRKSTIAIFCKGGEALFLVFDKDWVTYPKGLGDSPRFRVVTGADGVKEVLLAGENRSSVAHVGSGRRLRRVAVRLGEGESVSRGVIAADARG